VATSVDQASSMVLGCALAAGLALVSTLVCGPAVLALAGDDRHASGESPVASWLERRPAALAASLAASGRRTALSVAVAVALMIAAAIALLHAHSAPFSALDLPGDSPAREAARLVGFGQAGGGEGSLFRDLGLAAAVSAVALTLVLWTAFRERRVVPVALASLLPAAAACGLCALVFQDGYLAATLNQTEQGALETGATAALLSALVSVSAARAVMTLRASRDGRTLGLEPARRAQYAAFFVLPAAIVASLIAAAAVGVLGGASLYAAREFGLAIAVGLLIDLVLLRTPLVGALARWGGG
jgi:hypothetical protein